MFRFAMSPMNVIDLLAIMPFYLGLVVGSDNQNLAVVRVLRLSRVLRIFKLGKYSRSLQIFVRVVQKSSAALGMLVFFLAMITVLFGSLIYYAEAGEWSDTYNGFVRPTIDGEGEEISPFKSIPLSFWWVVVTITTVGYGDMVPTSVAGRLIATVAMYLGIIVLALPITIIGSNFTEEYQLQREAEQIAAEERQRRRELKKNKGKGSSMSLFGSIDDNDTEASHTRSTLVQIKELPSQKSLASDASGGTGSRNDRGGSGGGGSGSGGGGGGDTRPRRRQVGFAMPDDDTTSGQHLLPVAPTQPNKSARFASSLPGVIGTTQSSDLQTHGRKSALAVRRRVPGVHFALGDSKATEQGHSARPHAPLRSSLRNPAHRLSGAAGSPAPHSPASPASDPALRPFADITESGTLAATGMTDTEWMEQRNELSTLIRNMAAMAEHAHEALQQLDENYAAMLNRKQDL
jgi:uncharacterized membrane protein YgcG